MKKILVTGASSGIGQSTCELLLQKKYPVVGLARDFSKSTLCDPLFEQVNVDLSLVETLPKFLKTLSQNHLDLEALVLNAASGLFGFLEQLSYEQIIKNIHLNLLSQIYLTKAFLPLFKKKKRGTIIFMGSEAALQGKPQGSIYCASKFALRGFVQSLRAECHKSHVRLCLINPGVVSTPFFKALHFKPKEGELHSCHPIEIAKIIVDQIEARQGVVYEEVNIAPLQKQITLTSKSGT